MKRYLLIIAAVALLLSVTGCSQGNGEPPVLTIEGIEIILGESRPYDLTSQDFETTFPGNYMTIGELPGNSWLSSSSFMSAKKDGKTYAYLYIYNPNKETKTYGLSTIYKVRCKMPSEGASFWNESLPLLNGIDFNGMDNAAVKEAMSEYKLAHETDSGSMRFEDGTYKYFFSFDEETGLLEEIHLEMTIAKSYTETK